MSDNRELILGGAVLDRLNPRDPAVRSPDLDQLVRTSSAWLPA